MKLIAALCAPENFSNEWKSRETWDVISDEGFIETFELHGRSHLRRQKP